MFKSLTRAALAIACASTVAHAQLGSLIKKAKEQVESKAEKKAQPDVDSPPLPGDPLTSDTFGAVLKGLTFEAQQQNEAVALRRAWNQKADEWRAADKVSRPQETAYRDANVKQLNCMSSEMDVARRKYDAALEAKSASLGTDPKSVEFIKQIVDLSQRIAAAQQKHDTVTAVRLQGQIPRLLGMDPAQDSLAAFKKCGTPQPPPEAVVRTNKLRKEMDDMREDLRGVEGKLADRAAEAAGMPVKEYNMARERLYTWNSERKANEGKHSVTKDEDALFKSHLADIKKVEIALR